MKWLEIIELRSVGDNLDFIERGLKSLIDELNKETEHQAIKIYNRVGLDCDFSIHLSHNSKEKDIDGSPLALQLVSTLKEYGLVNHSAWIERINK